MALQPGKKTGFGQHGAGLHIHILTQFPGYLQIIAQNLIVSVNFQLERKWVFLKRCIVCRADFNTTLSLEYQACL